MVGRIVVRCVTDNGQVKVRNVGARSRATHTAIFINCVTFAPLLRARDQTDRSTFGTKLEACVKKFVNEVRTVCNIGNVHQLQLGGGCVVAVLRCRKLVESFQLQYFLAYCRL